MYFYVQEDAPHTPCMITVSGDRYINFFSLGPIQRAYNSIVDISQPTQWLSTYLYTGAKGDIYQLEYSAFFVNSATAHEWKYQVALSTGMMMNCFDTFGNKTPNQIFHKIKFDDEKIVLHANFEGVCYNGALKITGTMDMQPQG